MAKNNEITGWVGWVFFAGFMMIVMGVMQMIAGLTALLNDEWLLATQNNLLLLDFTTWGWFHLVLGLLVMLAGFSVLHGSIWARTVGVILAAVGLVANLAYVNAYPIWSLVIVALDAIIIYSLIVHGGELKNDV